MLHFTMYYDVRNVQTVVFRVCLETVLFANAAVLFTHSCFHIFFLLLQFFCIGI